jgi:virginiamycin B lyase
VRLTSEGELTAWPIATPNAQPDAVALAPDGSLWVTLTNVSRLLRVSPDGTMKEFPVEGSPLGVAVGKDGAVWFGAPGARRLCRFDPETKKTTWTALPEAPMALAISPDGSVWVALGSGDKLARVVPKA